MSRSEVFREIYRDDKWAHEQYEDTPHDFFSGSGSYAEELVGPYVSLLRELISKNEIRTIADLGYGGFNVGRRPADKTGPTKEEKQDDRDRIEAERFFSLDKRCNGAGLIMTKLEPTSLNTIALTVLVTNLFAVPVTTFFVAYFKDVANRLSSVHYLEIEPAA